MGLELCKVVRDPGQYVSLHIDSQVKEPGQIGLESAKMPCHPSVAGLRKSDISLVVKILNCVWLSRCFDPVGDAAITIPPRNRNGSCLLVI